MYLLVAAGRCGVGVDNLLDLIVQHQDKGTTGTTQDVRQGTLEEGAHALVRGDLAPAVQGSVVLLLSTSLHHQTTTNGVEGIRENACRGGDGLSDGPLGNEWGVLLVLEENALGCVVETEVGTAVHDDALDRDTEPLVERTWSTTIDGLGQAIDETGKLASLPGSDIGSQTSSCEIEGIDDEKRTSTGETAGGKVGHEEWPEIGLRRVFGEKTLDCILEGKVEGLGGEITNDVGQVTSPE